MMQYPYHCEPCDVSFDVFKDHKHSRRAEPCVKCGVKVKEQDYRAKAVRGYVSTEGDWTGGKMITQLPPSHPDYMVTSERGMEDAYKRNGLCMDTGKFVSKEAQVEATVPRHLRDGIADSVGGVRKE
jgi:hypothetical protein